VRGVAENETIMLRRDPDRHDGRPHRVETVSGGLRLNAGPPAPAGAPPLFYVVDWLPPDFGAVGQYALIFATEFARRGGRVRVIGLASSSAGTSRETFSDGGSLAITRIAAVHYEKDRYLTRLLWSFRANLRLIWCVIRDPESRHADVLFTGAPPFMLFFALLAKYLRGARLIYRITDFYPEVVIAAFGRRSFALALLERFTWFCRRRVDAFEALGEDQRRLLLAGGIAPEQVVVKRYTSPVAISGRDWPMPVPSELVGRRVLLYSGNLGVAHDVETLVEGLIRHHKAGSGRFGLWLNASGAGVETVQTRLRAAGVPLARSTPGPLEQLPALLAAADVHLITLRTAFSGIVVPSKVYGCLASRRPILFVGPESSDVHLLCSQQHDVSYCRVEPGNAQEFVAALERLCCAETQSITSP
jgi:hypothetical protein